jgi:hypothetical protein
MSLKLIQQTQIGLNQEALDEWVEYRRRWNKKPVNQPALDRIVKKLLSYGSEAEQQRMVDEAIEREWTGLYYVDPPKQPSSRQTSLSEDLNDRSWSR